MAMRMSDKRYFWTLVVACLTIVMVAAIWRYPEAVKASSAARDAKPGEYVYVDALEILHADRKCSRLNYKGMTCIRIKREDLHPHNYSSICPKCMSDKEYEVIVGLSK